jgi:hypothetical protein
LSPAAVDNTKKRKPRTELHHTSPSPFSLSRALSCVYAFPAPLLSLSHAFSLLCIHAMTCICVASMYTASSVHITRALSRVYACKTHDVRVSLHVGQYIRGTVSASVCRLQSSQLFDHAPHDAHLGCAVASGAAVRGRFELSRVSSLLAEPQLLFSCAYTLRTHDACLCTPRTVPVSLSCGPPATPMCHCALVIPH